MLVLRVMSRRRRKKAKHPSAAWLAIGAGLVIFLAVIAGAIGYWMVQRYLRSDDFRKLLSSKASHTIGIQGEFRPFLWDGFSVRCPGFQAASYPDGRLFNTITNGKGMMSGYGYNIPVRDRWAIVAYVRTLQAAKASSK